MTLLHHRSIVHVDILDPTIPTVPCYGEVTTLEDEACQVYVLAHCIALSSCDSLYSGVCILSELELLVSDHPILLEQSLSLLETELYIEHILLAISSGELEALESKYLLTLSRYVDIVNTAISHSLTLFKHCPYEVVVSEISEEILVAHLDKTLLQILGCSPNLLIVVAYLISVRIVAAVGSDDTVTVEVVVRCGIAAIVTTIGEDLLALLVGIAETLVYEVPNETTLQSGILTDEVPILLQATD